MGSLATKSFIKGLEKIRCTNPNLSNALCTGFNDCKNYQPRCRVVSAQPSSACPLTGWLTIARSLCELVLLAYTSSLVARPAFLLVESKNQVVVVEVVHDPINTLVAAYRVHETLAG